MAKEMYLMSIKPKFAYQIFTGKKKYELRRHIGINIEEHSTIILYVSGKVKAVMGEFLAGKVLIGSPVYVWEKITCLPDSGLDEDDWPYIEGSRLAMAIEVLKPKVYRRPISLAELRNIIPNFMPPLSYREISSYEPLYFIVKKLRKL